MPIKQDPRANICSEEKEFFYNQFLEMNNEIDRLYTLNKATKVLSSFEDEEKKPANQEKLPVLSDGEREFCVAYTAAQIAKKSDIHPQTKENIYKYLQLTTKELTKDKRTNYDNVQTSKNIINNSLQA